MARRSKSSATVASGSGFRIELSLQATYSQEQKIRS